MTYVPYAPEIGAFYTLTAGDGTVASFNNPADSNYCGILGDVTGLDSPDVRESADVLVQTDGGWHGNFWYGRRPITISGMTVNNVDAAARAVKLDKIRRVSNAMRQDAVLSWLNTAAGSVQMQTWVRRQMPVRFTGGYNKSFQMLLVSQFAPVFSTALHTPSAASTMTIENQGDYPSYPTIRIVGPTTGNPVVTNTTTGQVLRFSTAPVLTTGQYLDVDILNHTATFIGVSSINSYIDFLNTTWPVLIKGNNTFTLTGSASFQITYRDTWI